MEDKYKVSIGDELHDACVNGDLDAATAIISRRKTADASYNPPFPAMMYLATSNDRTNIVQYCLDNGGRVTDDVMKILLINRSKETYTLLLDGQAVDINYYIPWFGDILGCVATRDDFEWTRLCLRYGADPNRNLVDDYKSLLAAVAELASVEMAALLIEHGASVSGSGAIVMAAEEGKLEMVRLLLEKGADIDEIGIEHPTDERYKDDMGSALHRAVEGGYKEVVRFLIDKGASVDLKDMMGRTPLMLAQARKDKIIIEMLEKGSALG